MFGVLNKVQKVMNSYAENDIIIALATPYGRSAIAVIRLSGDGCFDLVNKRLKRAVEINKIKYNEFGSADFEEKLMVVGYKAPKSYTGEDMIELFPHGNPLVCDTIVRILIEDGARLAERGEFTNRAFTNGKIDLMQCEALADIIDAQTEEQLRYGNKRYDGEFKGLDEAEKLLNRALSTIEAVLHYGDELEGEEVDNGLINDVYGAIDEIIRRLEVEIDGYAGGRIVNDGFKVVIIGVPNVGKSTLLNVLTDSDRAIVTPIAGTTRDTVDGVYVFDGKKFVITDTAGMNEETTDEVEKIGIERAKAAAIEADAVIVMVAADGKMPDFMPENCKKVIVKNKCDDIADVGIDYKRAENGEILSISAKNNKNITALKRKLYDIAPKASGAVCNHRQYECVVRCLDACKAAKLECEKKDGLEIVAAALYDAYAAIQKLYGKEADESVISSIFERFCVGK